MAIAAELISDDYRALNRQLHESRADWGTTANRWSGLVQQLMKDFKLSDVLDYGCGKGALAGTLPFPIRQYDPAIPEYSALPAPAQLVACLDVLEHIEPEKIDAVLAHLQELVGVAGLFVVNTYPALNVLPDGRNAHVLMRPPRWWIGELLKRFDIIFMQVVPPDVVFVVRRLSERAE